MSDFNSSLPVRTESAGDVISKIADATTPAQQLAVTAGGRAKTLAHGLAGATETPLKVDSAGALFTIPTEPSGSPIVDYATSAAVVAGASVTHIYTAVATFTLEQLILASSGKLKVVLAVGAAGSPVDKAVFFNSTAGPNVNVSFPPDIVVTAGQVIKLTLTNKDNQTQDVYSTILGRDVA